MDNVEHAESRRKGWPGSTFVQSTFAMHLEDRDGTDRISDYDIVVMYNKTCDKVVVVPPMDPYQFCRVVLVNDAVHVDLCK